MRIALVITELDPGGAERCLTELAIFLSQRGHQVLVLALGPLPTAPYDGLLQQLSAAGVVVRSGNARGNWSAWRTVRWLRKELDCFAPNIVQTMLWHANVLAAVALRGSSVPLIGGMRVSEPRRWRWAIERWAARCMKHMVCVSEDVRRHALEKEGLPDAKLVVIPNGISVPPAQNAAQFQWSELGVQDAEHVLLFVGRFELQKGALSLAQRAPELLKELPGWSLVFMGKGSLQTQMESAIAGTETSPRVRIVGWQPHAADWMAACDIVLLPARYEGMPNVLLEAMAAGKPLVAFAVDGVAQLLADDYPVELARAQLAPPGDWPALIARACQLASDAALRRTCSDANRAQVAKHFRLEEQLAKYQSLYEAAAASSTVSATPGAKGSSAR